MRRLLGYLLVISLGTLCWAQSLPVRGRVTDSTGANLPSAAIRALRGEQLIAEAIADNQGNFEIVLPGGEIRLEVVAREFERHAETIQVQAGMLPLSISLEVAPLLQTLDVLDEMDEVSLEPDRNVSAFVFDNNTLQNLPDDPDELAQVLIDLAGEGSEDSPEMFVDGFSGGGLPPKEQIQEIRINSNPFSSEFSRPGRGRTQVITRAGTGEVHGNFNFNFRDDLFNARHPLADIKPPYQQKSFRGNIGGPLIRNVLSGSLSLTRSNEEESNQIRAVLPEGVFSRAIVHPDIRWSTEGRVEYRLGEQHTLNFSAQNHSRSQRNQGVGETSLAERAYNLDADTYGFQIRETAGLSATAVHELRFQYRRRISSTVPQTSSLAINVLDAFQAGSSQNRDEETQRTGDLGNALTMSLGSLTLKTGVQLARVSYQTLNEQNFLGTFVFSSLEAFRAGLPATFTVQTGNSALDLHQTELAMFIQNDWKATGKLMLSLGLRYEAQTNNGDRNNLDPRLGFAYALDRGTVLRGGGGLFHQRLNTNTFLSVRQLDGTGRSELVIQNPSYPDPFAGTAAGTVVLPRSVRARSEDLQLPYTLNSSLSLEKKLLRGLNVSLSYDIARGIHLFRSRNINAPLPESFLRPDLSQGNIEMLEASATSTYHSLRVRMNHRLGPHQLIANYTLSSHWNDSDGPFSLPADNYNLRAEWGRSPQDRRHHVSTSMALSLPWRLHANTRVQAMSGRPYEILTGFDDNRDTIVKDRPAGLFRNSGEGPVIFNIDLTFSTTMPFRSSGNSHGRAADAASDLQQKGPGRRGHGRDAGRPELVVSIDIRNLLNHTNFTRFSGVLSSPLFGQPLAARNSREIGLNVRFNF